ncbi:MAG: nitroreductase [Labilithrix sp.]|nr:nitroreductase [Labilithrix sp.]
MNRRRFLVGTAASALAAGCGGVVRADLEAPSQRTPLVDGKLYTILQFASLAPSNNNAQPWEVHVVGPRAIKIGKAPDRLMPVSDPTHRETLLSLGAFTENLVVAAECMGLTAEVKVVGEKPEDRIVLDVTFTQSEPNERERLDAIRSRVTMRSEFDSKELESRVVHLLSEAAGGLLYVPRNESDCAFLDDAAIASAKTLAFRDDARKEYANWVRFSNGDVNERRDGLTLPALGVTGFSGTWARTFKSSDSLLSSSSREDAVESTRKLVKSSAGWFVMTSKDASVAEIIDAGRRFERMHLLARQLNVGFHPMSQMIEDTRSRDGIAAKLALTGEPQLVIRVGRVVQQPNPVSPRRPVDWFVKRAT